MSYEQDEFNKLMTVVKAALQNPGHAQGVEIKTRGYDPSGSVEIEAYVLEKFLTPPKTK